MTNRTNIRRLSDREVRAVVNRVLDRAGYDYEALFGAGRTKTPKQIDARRWVWHEAVKHVGATCAAIARACGFEQTVVAQAVERPAPKSPPEAWELSVVACPAVLRCADDERARLERKRRNGEGLTAVEIAKLLGTTRQNVEQVERRALEKLRMALEAEVCG